MHRRTSTGLADYYKIDPYYQRRRCSPMTLDSGNIMFMRIFAGVPWKGDVVQQLGNRKRVFSRFRTLRIRQLRKWGQHYYIVLFNPLSPFHWPQNIWPWMTLNGVNGHNFHYYELPLSNYLLLIYLVCYTLVYVRDQRRSAGSGVADGDPQNIWNLRKKLRIFRRRYIVGTLANKANIII